jgi:hypothetical protein
VFAFSAAGRDLMSVAVRETPPENDPHGPVDLAIIVDCQLRQMAASPVTQVAKDGAPPTTAAGFKTSDLKPPNKGMYERFVVAVCGGELPGVKVSPTKSGWTHFVEGLSRALYFVNASSRTIGKYRAASMRLYELGDAQRPMVGISMGATRCGLSIANRSSVRWPTSGRSRRWETKTKP